MRNLSYDLTAPLMYESSIEIFGNGCFPHYWNYHNSWNFYFAVLWEGDEINQVIYLLYLMNLQIQTIRIYDKSIETDGFEELAHVLNVADCNELHLLECDLNKRRLAGLLKGEKTGNLKVGNFQRWYTHNISGCQYIKFYCFRNIKMTMRENSYSKMVWT